MSSAEPDALEAVGDGTVDHDATVVMTRPDSAGDVFVQSDSGQNTANPGSSVPASDDSRIASLGLLETTGHQHDDTDTSVVSLDLRSVKRHSQSVSSALSGDANSSFFTPVADNVPSIDLTAARMQSYDPSMLGLARRPCHITSLIIWRRHATLARAGQPRRDEGPIVHCAGRARLAEDANQSVQVRGFNIHLALC